MVAIPSYTTFDLSEEAFSAENKNNVWVTAPIRHRAFRNCCSVAWSTRPVPRNQVQSNSLGQGAPQ
jgi:hypothetical protein